MNKVHPAVRYIEDQMKLWDDDPDSRSHRARSIVCRLIVAGLLKGTLDHANGIPLDDAPSTAG